MKIISNHNKAIIALVFDAFSYAFLSVVSRWLNLGFQPFTQVYLRIFGALIISAIIFRKKIDYRKIVKMPISDWFWIAVMGVLGYGIMVYLVTMGSINTRLLNISVIMATVPFFSYILSIILLKKNFDIRTILLALVSLIGVSIIAGNSLIPRISGLGKGDAFVLVAAVLLALYSVGRKKLSSYLNNQEVTMMVIFMAFLTSFSLAMISGEKMAWNSFTIPIVVVGLLIGSVLNIISTFVESFSFQHLEAVLGNQVLLLENLFSPLLGYFLYKEGLGLYQVIGATIIIGSVYLNNKYAQ